MTFCDNLLNIFTKHEFTLEMFVAVGWSYSRVFTIVRSTVPLVDHTVVKIWILALPYKSTPSFVKISSSLKKST